MLWIFFAGAASWQNETKERLKVVAVIMLMTYFPKLWWFFIQIINFSSIDSQSIHLNAGLEPLGMDVFYLMGAKQFITLAVGFSWLWDPKSGRGQQRRSPEGQCYSLLWPRNFKSHELSVRRPSTAGWGCWAGASWTVTLSFHAVVFCFDTIVTIKKKKREVIDYSRTHANLSCYFSKLICA